MQRLSTFQADVSGVIAGSSLTTPSLLRGTVSAALWSGVTKGTGLSSVARQANLTALQAAVSYAATNRKFFELEPGDYEIEGTAGLVIPQTKNTGFVWKGTKGSHIKQFSNNCPVITIGNISGTGLTEQAVVEGFRASYNTDQSANTASTAVIIGSCRNCTFGEWDVFADYPTLGFAAGSGVKAYKGIRTQHATDSLSYFSNTMHDVMVGGCQQNFIDLAAGGTGSVFSNIYMSQGVTGTPQSIADYPLRLRGAGDLYESVFEQINIEWCTAQYLVFAEICRNTSLLSWHLEGNKLSGFDPAVFNVSSAQLNIIGLNLLDLTVQSATATGTRSVFRTYGACAITGSGLALNWTGSGSVNTALNLVDVTSFTPSDQLPAINVTGLVTRDVAGGNATNFQLDANTPLASNPSPIKVDWYRWHEVLPEVVGATVKTSASPTIYGCFSDPTVLYPASIGAARTLVLSGQMKAAGSLSTVAVPTGALATVRRGPGTADGFSVVVKALTSGGTTLSTISTADTVARYRFNGTTWAVVT